MNLVKKTTMWPVALEREVLPASLARAGFFGKELVVWRGDDDVIRVWEDHCPHRSVRLSAGRNLGDSIQCIYHGWRYGKDGTVIEIPALNHEARSDISVNVMSSAVAGGLVWVTKNGGNCTPDNVQAGNGAVLLRPLPINVDADAARAGLQDASDGQLFITPADENACTVFGYAMARGKESEIETARRCNAQLSRLRRRLEAGGTT
ncbi:Rieske 2Fe-2S domain-containing protein [Hoeflea sp. TYP-13]|uniref:Rieske 2Fe-2S domain-containing protein n=1 Tax=Hoeflea sp. TYP-13 TaxID=3230023 RepID=UPI0034C63106